MEKQVEQEMVLKFQMFEQQIQMIQQQLQAVEQAIVELGGLKLGLDELVGKEGSEIKAPVGRGIYATAKLTSEDLMVDIGGKNFVKKTIPETKEIISEQIKKLEDVRGQLEGEMEKINEELTKVFAESQENHECECGDNCECGHGHGEGCGCED